MSGSKYLLMAVVERPDGTTFQQVITYLTEEHIGNRQFIEKCIQNYRNMIGKEYWVVETWIE